MSTVSPLIWFGGKGKQAEYIIGRMPGHKVYVEPFGGSAHVISQKPRINHEVYNDIDGVVVNFIMPRRRIPMSEEQAVYNVKPNMCGSCKYAEPLPNQVFKCTHEGSGYYKVGAQTLSCDKFTDLCLSCRPAPKSNPISPEQREEIQKAVREATPGPWVSRGARVYKDGERLYAPSEIGITNNVPNAHLVANATEWLRLLLSSEQVWREENERLLAFCKLLASEEEMYQEGKYETEMSRLQQETVELSKFIIDQNNEIGNIQNQLNQAVEVLKDCEYQLQQSNHPAGLGMFASITAFLYPLSKDGGLC